MRTVNIIHHAHGTTVQVEDDRPVLFGNSWLTHHPDLALVRRGTRYHYLPTPASLKRLTQVIDNWPHRAAYINTYQEVK